MEVSVDEVSYLVRGWLSSPLRAPSRPLPLYQPISPRPERLGLGAEVSVNTAPPRIVTDSKVWQSVSGKRKSQHPFMSVPKDKLSTAPDCHIQESCSDDDTSCSRSAAIGNAKRNNPATSFTIQSRKRRRRRKKDKTIEHDTNNVNKDRENGKSVRTTPQLTQPASCGTTSTCTTVLDNHLHTNSTRLHDVEDKCESSRGGETFQLFVHIDGDSVGEEPTCQPEYGCQESKQRRCRKMKISTKQALRGGSAQYCDKRTRKRLLKCKTKHHPSTELSNCHTPITSMGASRSNSVSKQGALCEESYDRLKGKELRQSHTPPSVDTGHHVTEVTQYEGSKSHREAGMEKSGHRGRITRGNSGHKRRVMRYRKGRRLTQNSSDSLIRRLYLRKI